MPLWVGLRKAVYIAICAVAPFIQTSHALAEEIVLVCKGKEINIWGPSTNDQDERPATFTISIDDKKELIFSTFNNKWVHATTFTDTEIKYVNFSEPLTVIINRYTGEAHEVFTYKSNTIGRALTVGYPGICKKDARRF